MLILFRGIQGVGAGALFPIALAVIGDLFTPAGTRQVPGPLRRRLRHRVPRRPALGGFLTDNVSWHWIFYVNIPIGHRRADRHLARCCRRSSGQARPATSTSSAAAIFTVAISVPAGRPHQQAVRRLGRPGRRRAHRSSASSSATLPVHRAESRAKEPIIPLDLFRNRTYSASMLSTFLVSFGVLRRDHLPAALVPVRPRLERDRLRATRSCRCSSA